MFVRVNAICESRMAQTTNREAPPNVINFVNKFTLLSTLLLLIFYQRINDLLLGSHIIFPYQCLAMFHVYILIIGEQIAGLEPVMPVWKTRVLTNYTIPAYLGNFTSPYDIYTNVYILFFHQGHLYNVPNLD